MKEDILKFEIWNLEQKKYQNEQIFFGKEIELNKYVKFYVEEFEMNGNICVAGNQNRTVSLCIIT